MDLQCFMKFRIQGTQPSVEMHPCQEFPASQDAFHRLEIIPARHFLLIRMIFPAGNHPCMTFPANQDAFLHWKSSLPGIFCNSGCIPTLNCIPRDHECMIRMLAYSGIFTSLAPAAARTSSSGTSRVSATSSARMRPSLTSWA